MRIPGTLAVMALPGAVLFPGSMLPLYIFEPRYRKMLADARVEDLPSESRTPLLAQTLRAEVKQLCGCLLKGSAKPIVKLLESACDHAEFSDFVGANLVQDQVIRQRLMEEPETTRRLEILAAHLSSLIP